MTPTKLTRGGAIALTTVLVLGCSSGGGPSPSESTPTTPPASQAPASAPVASASAPAASASAATIGPAEQTDLKIGMWLPNVGSVAPLWVAVDRGYFKDEGLNVEPIVVADTRAAVIGDSVAIGVLDYGPVAQAIKEDLAIQVLGTWRCRRSYAYAVRPEIETAADLSGKDIVIEFVPGEPDGNVRKALLKKVGWDLDAVNPPPNEVIVPGFSNAATKLFVAGTLYGMPVYTQTRTPTIEAGGQMLVDTLSDWPNDVLFAKADWIAANPNTIAHVLRAVMRALQDTLDPSQQNDILALLKAKGVATENEEKTLAANPNALALNQVSYCPNLYFDQPQSDELLTAMGFAPLPAWDQLADIDPLLAAQASMGLTNDLPPPPGS